MSLDSTAPLFTPPPRLDLSFVSLPVGSLLHRVHGMQHTATEFNPGYQGNARFSPIQRSPDRPVPTLYAGSSRDCALMETVFHDVPYLPGYKTLDLARLDMKSHTILALQHTLQLVDLRSIALHKLGISRAELIDCEKAHYPRTRAWAQAIYQQCPQAQGLLWTSRRDDSAQAYMLFGDRVPADALRVASDSLSLRHHLPTWEAVLALAERLGVCLAPGQG